jgi:hypothetical protein
LVLRKQAMKPWRPLTRPWLSTIVQWLFHSPGLLPSSAWAPSKSMATTMAVVARIAIHAPAEALIELSRVASAHFGQ